MSANDDMLDLLSKQLSGQLKHDLEKWSRERLSVMHTTITIFFGLVSACIAIFSIVGIPAMVDKAVETQVKSRLQQEDEIFKAWEKMTQAAFEKVSEAAANGTAQINAAVVEANKATRAAEDETGKAIAKAQLASEKADAASEKADLAAKAADAAGARLSPIEAPPDVLSASKQSIPIGEADKNAVWIKQEPRKTTQPVRENDTRVYTELTFSVYIDTSQASRPSADIISQIERVVYKFDSRWFNPSEQRSTSLADNFSYSIRVWGSTNVKAEIYFRGVADPLVRSGRMNLEKTDFFKTDFLKANS
jgi:hypothetical protein